LRPPESLAESDPGLKISCACVTDIPEGRRHVEYAPSFKGGMNSEPSFK